MEITQKNVGGKCRGKVKVGQLRSGTPAALQASARGGPPDNTSTQHAHPHSLILGELQRERGRGNACACV